MTSQAQYETFDVVIEASPPYGFRLVQKLMDNSLVVSKLRQGGRAEEAGLKEGDVLRAVNSRSCEGFNCTQALNLIDSASQPLVLTVKRKAGTHPKPTNQPVIIRQTNFLPKKKLCPNQTPLILPPTSPKPKVSPEPAPRATTVSVVLSTPPKEDKVPTKVFVGSTYHEQKEDPESEKKVEFGDASSIIIDPLANISSSLDLQKKTYTDSGFFSDPSKYPTLEEQVQLARRVAMSVLAPINANSKGHKMFLKAKERAVKYTTGRTEDDEEEEGSGLGETLHNMPKKIAFVPKLPTDSTNERINAMSNEELELMRLQERKTTHTGVSPQVCFSLADDLKNMKGKGGKLFAKRQAKSESWTVGGGGVDEEIISQVQMEENAETKEREHKQVMDKLSSKHQMEKSLRGENDDSVASLGYGVAPVNKLDSMIRAAKSALSPWEAAAEYGNVDKAFEHLDEIDSQLNIKPQTSQFHKPQLTTQRPAQNHRPVSLVVQVDPAAQTPQFLPTTTEDFARMRTTQARSPGYRPIKFNPVGSSIESPPTGIPISDA